MAAYLQAILQLECDCRGGGSQTGHHHPKPKPHTNFTFNGIHIFTYLFYLFIYSVCLEQFGSPGRWQGAFARLRPASIMVWVVPALCFFVTLHIIAWHCSKRVDSSWLYDWLPTTLHKNHHKPPYLVTTLLLPNSGHAKGCSHSTSQEADLFEGSILRIVSALEIMGTRWYPLVMTNIAMVAMAHKNRWFT